LGGRLLITASAVTNSDSASSVTRMSMRMAIGGYSLASDGSL
jgi:hypothetical protein